MDNPTVYGIGKADLARMWPLAAPLIETALLYCDGKYSLDAIKKAIQSKAMQLWMGFDKEGVCGACVTQIVQFPHTKRLTILFFGGRRTHALLQAQTIFDWAQKKGCTAVELFGRPGWGRLMQRWGYDFETIHTVLRLKLTREQPS